MGGERDVYARVTFAFACGILISHKKKRQSSAEYRLPCLLIPTLLSLYLCLTYRLAMATYVHVNENPRYLLKYKEHVLDNLFTNHL